MSNDVQNGKKKKRVSLKVILVMAAVLALMGAGAWLFSFVSANRGTDTATPDRRSEKPYLQYSLGDFTVNLADPGQRRYLKVQITVAFAEKNMTKELEQRNPQLRDLVIEVLRSRTAAQLTEGNVDLLRSDLLAGLNNLLDRGEIREIYFTEFLVQ